MRMLAIKQLSRPSAKLDSSPSIRGGNLQSTSPAQIPRGRPYLRVKAAIENGYVPAVKAAMHMPAFPVICRALGDIGNLVGPFNTRCNVGKENATKKPVLTEKAAQVGHSAP